MTEQEICQACGRPIAWGSKVVAVRYGTIRATVKHTAVSKDAVDYFHEDCDKAFRTVDLNTDHDQD